MIIKFITDACHLPTHLCRLVFSFISLVMLDYLRYLQRREKGSALKYTTR